MQVMHKKIELSEIEIPKGTEFLCIINEQGRIEQSVLNGMILAKEKLDMFAMGIRLQNSMQSDYDCEFGPVNFAITERHDTKFVWMSTPCGILMGKLSKSADPIKFVNKINKVLCSEQ